MSLELYFINQVWERIKHFQKCKKIKFSSVYYFLKSYLRMLFQKMNMSRITYEIPELWDPQEREKSLQVSPGWLERKEASQSRTQGIKIWDSRVDGGFSRINRKIDGSGNQGNILILREEKMVWEAEIQMYGLKF